MKKYILLFSLMAALLSCKKDKSIDTQLIGPWSDYNAFYQFNNDFTYYTKYLRIGSGADSVKVDSVWGTYELDRKRVNVTFNQHGYRQKYTGIVYYQNANPDTWHYSIQNDTVLNYNSHTTLGTLIRQ
jgi:hypothetical protein